MGWIGLGGERKNGDIWYLVRDFKDKVLFEILGYNARNFSIRHGDISTVSQALERLCILRQLIVQCETPIL